MGPLPFGRTWMDPESSMLSEKSQTEKGRKIQKEKEKKLFVVVPRNGCLLNPHI